MGSRKKAGREEAQKGWLRLERCLSRANARFVKIMLGCFSLTWSVYATTDSRGEETREVAVGECSKFRRRLDQFGSRGDARFRKSPLDC